MVAIAVGMSVTTTVVSYAALLGRRGLSSAARGRQTLLSRGHGVLALLGSHALFAAGLLLLGQVDAVMRFCTTHGVTQRHRG